MTRHLKCLVKFLLGLMFLPLLWVLHTLVLLVLLIVGGVITMPLHATGCCDFEVEDLLFPWVDFGEYVYNAWRNL